MAHSSSGSWSGAAGAEVIDLDRFMRGARPHRPSPPPPSPNRTRRNELVVDPGGLSRKPAAPSSSSSEASVRRAERRAEPAHAHKRFSHDSGVSDGSYVKRRSRPHRRYSVAESAGIKTKRDNVAARASGSTGSMRAFRVTCERTLRDQQRQLARVALLCERLGERRERSETERTTKTDSSELSSSSRSTRDPRRKDKNRAQEFKTYKIIMSKLDELNRVFVSRRSPAPSPARPARRVSSATVSVSDKLVATEPTNRNGRLIAPRQKCASTRGAEMKHRELVEVAVGSPPPSPLSPQSAETARAARLAALRAVNNAYALDIAPHDAVPNYPNIATESVVKRGSSIDGSRTTVEVGDPRFAFDLDDPVQLYAQAKRLQAMHVSSRRARSSAPTATSQFSRGGGAAVGSKKGGGAGVSLCALCREYWRALREYITAQVCCPRDDLPCACS